MFQVFCSSLYNDGCDDNFSNNPTFTFDFSKDPTMNLTSSQHCRLIKYWSTQLFWYSFPNLISILSILLFFLVNDTWIVDRDCNRKDNISNVDEAKAYLCNCDYCNSSTKLNSIASYLLFISNVMLLKFLIKGSEICCKWTQKIFEKVVCFESLFIYSINWFVSEEHSIQIKLMELSFEQQCPGNNIYINIWRKYHWLIDLAVMHEQAFYRAYHVW